MKVKLKLLESVADSGICHLMMYRYNEQVLVKAKVSHLGFMGRVFNAYSLTWFNWSLCACTGPGMAEIDSECDRAGTV